MPPQEISSFIITNNPGCQTSRGRRHSACPSTFSQSIRGSRENAMRIAYMLVCVSGDIILPLIFAMPPAWVSRLTRVGLGVNFRLGNVRGCQTGEMLRDAAVKIR